MDGFALVENTLKTGITKTNYHTMNITKVNIGKTISTGNYCSFRVDMESTVDANETPEQVMLSLTQRIDNFVKETHPELYSSEQTEIPVQEIENKLSMEERTIQDIGKCTVFEKPYGLDQYTLMANNPSTLQSIKEAYSKRLNELSNG